MENQQPRLTYRFLIKPVFFIVSLLIVAYLVLKLETVTPEDLGMEVPSYHDAEVKAGNKK